MTLKPLPALTEYERLAAIHLIEHAIDIIESNDHRQEIIDRLQSLQSRIELTAIFAPDVALTTLEIDIMKYLEQHETPVDVRILVNTVGRPDAATEAVNGLIVAGLATYKIGTVALTRKGKERAESTVR